MDFLDKLSLHHYDLNDDGEISSSERFEVDYEEHHLLMKSWDYMNSLTPTPDYYDDDDEFFEDLFSPRERLLDAGFTESDLEEADFDGMLDFEQDDYANKVEAGLVDTSLFSPRSRLHFNGFKDSYLLRKGFFDMTEAEQKEFADNHDFLLQTSGQPNIANKVIKESDYHDRRTFEAVQWLDDIEKDRTNLSRKQKEKEIKKCKFILESDALAAKYLTVSDGFDYGRALKDHFELPINIQKEHLFDFDNLFNSVIQIDYRVAVDMWIWCVNTFGEYQDYMDYSYNLYNSVLVSLYEGPKENLIYFFDKLKNNNELIDKIFAKNPEFPASVERLIAIAFELGNDETALDIFNSVLKKPDAKGERLEWCISGIISECETYKSAKRMKAFERTIYPVIKNIEDKKVQRMLPRYKEAIYPYINSVSSKK